MQKKAFPRLLAGLRRTQRSLARVGPVLWQTIQRFEGTERRRDAAALTYTTLFALVPVLTVIYATLSAIPALQSWGGDLSNNLLAYVMPEGSEQISAYLLAFSQQARSLTWIGVVFLFITALMLLRTIEMQFNRIWNVDKPRSGLQNFFRYWAVLSLGPLLIGGAIAASSLVASLPMVADLDKVPLPFRFLPWLFSAAALTALYMLVPNCRVPWRNALLAAMLIALLFEAGKFLFARIIGLFPSYQLIYGAFAAVPLFLLWIYLAWMLVLLGAELSYALSHYAPANRKLPPLWRRLRLVQTLVQLQQQGRLLSEAALARRLPDLTPVQVRVGLQQLQQMGLVTRSQEGQWVWLADPHSVTLGQLLQDLSLSDLQAGLPADMNVGPVERQRWQQWQQDWQQQNQSALDIPLHAFL